MRLTCSTWLDTTTNQIVTLNDILRGACKTMVHFLVSSLKWVWDITWSFDFVQFTIYWKKVGRMWSRKKSNPLGVWFLYLLTGELNSFLQIQTKIWQCNFHELVPCFCQPSARYCVIFLSHIESSINGWKI